MMNRSLFRRGAVGTCVACGHILSQSRSNFNSINSKQGAASDNDEGGSQVLYKRD